MKITFRQGIVRRQSNMTAPNFLRRSNTTTTSIDLVISPDPVIFTAAHYAANYLFEESKSIDGAWGSGALGSTNGPMVPNEWQYLYWDINLATGELTRGWTSFAPIVSATEPTNPVNDQHWFDVVNSRMRVFRQPNPAINGNWQDKIRVFAGEYTSGAAVIAYQAGTQVGLNAIPGEYFNSGNIILGVNNRPLKQSDGTFVTTESDLIIYQTSSQNVKFDMALTFAQAQEYIPAFYLVSVTPGKKMKLASSNDIYQFVNGVVVEDLYQDEVGQFISNGVVRNEQWDWQPDQINKPVFCGPTGEIRLTPPVIGVLQQVGFIYDENSIYFNIFPPVRLK